MVLIAFITFILLIIGILYFKKDSLEKYIGKWVLICMEKNRRSRYPKRIILIRHGESEANLNPKIYESIPDFKISLSEKGKEQAKEAGKKLKELIGNESVLFYVSPYLRTNQTYEYIKEALVGNKIKTKIEYLIREIEFGNYHYFDDDKMQEIKDFGKFFYRYDNGESCGDVGNRVFLFRHKLYEKMGNIRYTYRDNIVLVTHECFMRNFMLNFLHHSSVDYDKIRAPTNCELWILNKNKRGGYDIQNNIYKEKIK